MTATAKLMVSVYEQLQDQTDDANVISLRPAVSTLILT